jgi:Rod binding domain-containing protein
VSVGATDTSGLPIVNQALEPSWVRHGSATTQKAYETALSFEETLVEQLSKSLAATSGMSDEESSGEGESSEEGSSELSSMLPQALSSSVMSAGGLGLAAELTHGLSTQVATTGGSPA